MVCLCVPCAGIVYNITGGKDLTLQEVNRVSEVVTSLADPSCNIIFGAVVDEAYDGIINVTIIATGFSQSYEEQLFGRPATTTGRKANEPAAQAAPAAPAPAQQRAPAQEAPSGNMPWNRPNRADRGFLGRSIL